MTVAEWKSFCRWVSLFVLLFRSVFCSIPDNSLHALSLLQYSLLVSCIQFQSKRDCVCLTENTLNIFMCVAAASRSHLVTLVKLTDFSTRIYEWVKNKWESNSDEEEKKNPLRFLTIFCFSSLFRTELYCCLLAGEMNDDLISMWWCCASDLNARYNSVNIV